MTIQYAIVAFPSLDHGDRIEAVRQRIDPLAGVLRAHVTLVFPFADDAVAPHLQAHVARAVSGISAFDITLTGPTVADGGYLFLEVASGAELLVRLHDQLYSGLLAPYLSSAHSYEPHITLGRLATAEELGTAARDAHRVLGGALSGRVTELSAFRLDQPTRGVVEFTVPLDSTTSSRLGSAYTTPIVR